MTTMADVIHVSSSTFIDYKGLWVLVTCVPCIKAHKICFYIWYSIADLLQIRWWKNPSGTLVCKEEKGTLFTILHVLIAIAILQQFLSPCPCSVSQLCFFTFVTEWIYLWFEIFRYLGSGVLVSEVFFLSVDLVSAGPICRQCLDAANITECITRTIECWDKEVKQ